MGNVMKSALCAILAVAAAGCATISCTTPGGLDGLNLKGTDGRPSQIVVIETTGYYLLWAIPLCSGDVRWNEEKQSIEGGFSMFKDHVSIENLQRAITNYADRRNCDLVDVLYNDDDTTYAGVSESGIIGVFFGSSTMGVSAVLVPRSTEKQGN